jgi:hypothetical protein
MDLCLCADINHRRFKMKSKAYNGVLRSSEKDFETLQLGVFATPGLLLAQGALGLTVESGFIGSLRCERAFCVLFWKGCESDLFSVTKKLGNNSG